MNFQALKLQISQAIEEKDFSILEVEKKAGIPRDTLRNFLSGRVKEPKIETIKAASRLLNIDINEHFLNNSSSKKTSHLETCNLDILEKCCTSIAQYAEHKKKKLSFDEFVNYLKKIYEYHKDYSPENINESFISWCMDQDKK
jgi:transcriptional regulator with XRE-family HTH domain